MNGGMVEWERLLSGVDDRLFGELDRAMLVVVAVVVVAVAVSGMSIREVLVLE